MAEGSGQHIGGYRKMCGFLLGGLGREGRVSLVGLGHEVDCIKTRKDTLELYYRFY